MGKAKIFLSVYVSVVAFFNAVFEQYIHDFPAFQAAVLRRIMQKYHQFTAELLGFLYRHSQPADLAVEHLDVLGRIVLQKPAARAADGVAIDKIGVVKENGNAVEAVFLQKGVHFALC